MGQIVIIILLTVTILNIVGIILDYLITKRGWGSPEIARIWNESVHGRDNHG